MTGSSNSNNRLEAPEVHTAAPEQRTLAIPQTESFNANLTDARNNFTKPTEDRVAQLTGDSFPNISIGSDHADPKSAKPATGDPAIASGHAPSPAVESHQPKTSGEVIKFGDGGIAGTDTPHV